MKQLSIIIACAFAAQAQADDYRLRRELREIEDQQDELIEQNERIEGQLRSDRLDQEIQGQRIERQIKAQNDSERIDRWISERSVEPHAVIEKPAPTPEPKPLPPLLLPSNGLNDYEVLEKLPAGSIIHAPEGDIIVK